MLIEIVCPKRKDCPVPGEIIGHGVMKKEVWEDKEGLSGAEVKLWKTITVRCFHCGEQHEYALVMYPS